MTRGKREDGQILLPALFILPAFVLIAVLLVEVGNLSRGKIRQQFALDVAAHLEMTQYADVLNRLSYLNGAFPDRIFREVYGQAWGEYWQNGLYPGSGQPVAGTEARWPIRFAGQRAYANVPDPPVNFGVLHTHLPGSGAVTLEHANQVAFSYISIYQWLGDVAAAQKLVFERTSLRDRALLRKSMWMNLHDEGTSLCGGVSTCGDEAAGAFGGMNIRFHYVQGFKHCPVIVTVQGSSYQGELSGAFDFQGNGLWNLATVPADDLANVEEGFTVKHHWQPRRNYFGIDFVSEMRPYVQAHVSALGGRVWPDPTPYYMTRLTPGPGYGPGPGGQ